MNNLTVTFGILTHNEPQIFDLLDLLLKHKDKEDKIIVVDDNSDASVIKRLKQYPIRVIQHSLNQDYSAQRNIIVEAAKTDYLFMIDADEMPTIKLLKELKTIITKTHSDAIWCPRVNIFKGVKPIHALMYGWSLQGEICNYPDMQCRIIKLRQGIKWVGRLHERPKLEKQHQVIQLPVNTELELIHIKDIETQLKQNEMYNQKFSQEENRGTDTIKLLQS